MPSKLLNVVFSLYVCLSASGVWLPCNHQAISNQINTFVKISMMVWLNMPDQMESVLMSIEKPFFNMKSFLVNCFTFCLAVVIQYFCHLKLWIISHKFIYLGWSELLGRWWFTQSPIHTNTHTETDTQTHIHPKHTLISTHIHTDTLTHTHRHTHTRTHTNTHIDHTFQV